MNDIFEPLGLFQHVGSRRWLQPANIQNYTSPPLPGAIQATPVAYRSDEVIDAARAAAAAGNCTIDTNADGNRCHIPFAPPSELFDDESKVGVIFYGGGRVDPRAYSPIAHILANRYGLPVVIPIFDRDIALGFGPGAACDTGRIDLAQAEFEFVEQWVLAGHSLGGVAAMADAWTRLYNSTTSNSSSLDDDDDDDSSPLVGGLALLASRVQDVGCGDTDFSTTNLPMAFVTASLDPILNTTLAEENKTTLSNYTLDLDIFGGNHAQFGAYNYSERTTILGPQQVDGVAIIPPEVQWDLTAASIYHVASRLNVSLPMRIQQEELECPPPPQETSSSSSIRAASVDTTCSLWITAPFALVAWLLKR